VLEEPDSKQRRRLESAELPVGVADGMVRLLIWRGVLWDSVLEMVSRAWFHTCLDV
jgi:hypothetical protein